MSRLSAFVGQACLAFLPVLVIQLLSLTNLSLAALLSQSFAIVSVLFSVSYMAQRQYVNIYGPIGNDIRGDIKFRLKNVVVASALSLMLLKYYEVAFYVAFFSITIKLSESLLDYLYGYFNHTYGFKKGARSFFKLSFVRFMLLLALMTSLYYFVGLNESYVWYLIGVSSIIFLLVVTFTFYYKFPRVTEKKLFNGYKSRIKILFPFSISASLCAFLVVLPRWLVDVGSESDNIFLVSFSLVPVFGVLFNTLFASYIELARVNISESFKKLLLIVVSVNILFYFSDILLLPIITALYSYSYDLAEVYLKSVKVGVFFFSSILFANFYKFNKPYLEGATYLVGIITMFTLNFTGFTIYTSIMITSLVVFLLSMLSLKVKQ
ncbi:hypothetical protein [Kangiella sp. HZ709]|uniref:hypothetical protein n=1 Tax=Kangiella sp. HZ709 TaxID=2666328 RepID=UPI0012B147BD|nr:hypothetical protein [Kangiella sp. HZ709]MRX27153.1 hypothetical protein [Kangiella sp. HZ709]